MKELTIGGIRFRVIPEEGKKPFTKGTTTTLKASKGAGIPLPTICPHEEELREVFDEQKIEYKRFGFPENGIVNVMC